MCQPFSAFTARPTLPSLPPLTNPCPHFPSFMQNTPRISRKPEQTSPVSSAPDTCCTRSHVHCRAGSPTSASVASRTVAPAVPKWAPVRRSAAVRESEGQSIVVGGTSRAQPEASARVTRGTTVKVERCVVWHCRTLLLVAFACTEGRKGRGAARGDGGGGQWTPHMPFIRWRPILGASPGSLDIRGSTHRILVQAHSRGHH